MNLDRLANESSSAARPSAAPPCDSRAADSMPTTLGRGGLHSGKGRAEEPMLLDRKDRDVTAQSGLQGVARAAQIQCNRGHERRPSPGVAG